MKQIPSFLTSLLLLPLAALHAAEHMLIANFPEASSGSLAHHQCSNAIRQRGLSDLLQRLVWNSLHEIRSLTSP